MFPNIEIVEAIRKEYPVGTRVRLTKMDDIQAPPLGTEGTVVGVDDTGGLLMHWDNGSHLNVVYGADEVEKVEQTLKASLLQTASDIGITIAEMECMPDHIHLLADCSPQCFIPDMIKVLKGNSARAIFIAHPELKKQLWGGHLWNPSYFVATVSDNTRQHLQEYIASQKAKGCRKEASR